MDISMLSNHNEIHLLTISLNLMFLFIYLLSLYKPKLLYNCNIRFVIK